MEKIFLPDDIEIIDMHVHPFETGKQCIAAYPVPFPPEQFHSELLRAGISRYAGSVIEKIGPADFARIRHLNRTALRLRDKHPEYIPGIHVHGSFVEESCAELHEMKSHGVKLIGELVPYSLGTGSFNTPGMLEIFKEAARLGMIANLHHVTREEAEFLTANVPELIVIFAHPGDLSPDWGAAERMKFVASHKNVYMDLSGTGLFRWNLLRYSVDLCGAEKILFGSDFPICSAGMNVYGVLSEHLTRQETELIFAGNFKRLMGM